MDQEEDVMMAELKKIYKEAWDEGIWVHEFGGTEGYYLAAAGCLKELETIEKGLGRKINVGDLTLGDCFKLGSSPGNGKTRQEACLNAIKDFKRSHRRHLKYHKIEKSG